MNTVCFAVGWGRCEEFDNYNKAFEYATQSNLQLVFMMQTGRNRFQWFIQDCSCPSYCIDWEKS